MLASGCAAGQCRTSLASQHLMHGTVRREQSRYQFGKYIMFRWWRAGFLHVLTPRGWATKGVHAGGPPRDLVPPVLYRGAPNQELAAKKERAAGIIA